MNCCFVVKAPANAMHHAAQTMLTWTFFSKCFTKFIAVQSSMAEYE